MKEIKIRVTEELYDFYQRIGVSMDSSAEEIMEMMLRVCATRIQQKKKETFS